MKQLFIWFYWFYILSARCNHTPNTWIMREAGMGKFKCCNERPVEVILPEEIKDYPEIVRNISYTLHSTKGKITYV